MSPASVATPFRGASSLSLRTLVPLTLLFSAGGMGCFRATGVARPNVAVEEIPATGGDRVAGLKATAGPGDFYLGNDSIQLAIDGAAFGDREGQFGAPSGGAVLDVGSISLDQSFHRVSMPTDMLERLGPVANQDPELPLVFDRYMPGTETNSVRLDMQGYLLDPKGKLGVATDLQGRVAGVSVSHRITLNKGEIFFTLETTLTPASGTALPVKSVGDFLFQRGGGFRFNVPANANFDGTIQVHNWGVEIPGTDFSDPLHNSVRASMVALMGSESAANTVDSHASLGILPIPDNADEGVVLVASDPQHALSESRPLVPARLVVGSPVKSTPLGVGESLTYRRRIYVVGGPSYATVFPAQATTVFNLMAQAKGGLQNQDLGYLAFSVFGTAIRNGPLQTEFKVERYIYKGVSAADSDDPVNLSNPSNWRLERAEWLEPTEIQSGQGPIGMLLPVIPDPTTGFSYRYRITARNAQKEAIPLVRGTNALDSTRALVPTFITPSKTQLWQVVEALSPERNDPGVLDSVGNVIGFKQTAHGFSARQVGTLEYGGLNPLRLTFLGLGVPDPKVQRTRLLSSIYSEVFKEKIGAGANYGSYHYTAGNQIFGTAFGSVASTAVMFFPPGDYLAYATRGPMSHLDSLPVKAFSGQDKVTHGFVVSPPTLPAGWTSFDVPAPTQMTTGGFNPGELLSSAVAEGIQVVARTEEDVLTDPTALRTEFRAEIDVPAVTDAQRAPLGADPFVVGARSSSLADGFTTALFTPSPTTDRNGGARPSKGWNLAEFITQAEGGYTIVHQPRGAKGLFTVRGFDRTVPLGTGANAWWTQTGPSSLGKRVGDFDAIELLRAEGCNPADPTAWYAEYSTLRDDWFAILSQQTPTAFTKGLGLSAARYSLDTPVGLARTYLKLAPSTTLSQTALDPVLAALRSGAAVASTGPLLDVSVGAIGPGGLVTGTNATVSVTISLYAPDWVPVDEVRLVVNGSAPVSVPLASFTASATDPRLRTATVSLPMPSGKDAWVVAEAGVARTQTGAYRTGTPWNKIMKGIYPIAVTNPIFVDVNGGGYTPPGL
ncbi:MAG: hypothetical protein LWW79_04690 [Holophagaceae bacterium]|nr:hypothetical protein [Holophagaceae bacterium]